MDIANHLITTARTWADAHPLVVKYLFVAILVDYIRKARVFINLRSLAVPFAASVIVARAYLLGHGDQASVLDMIESVLDTFFGSYGGRIRFIAEDVLGVVVTLVVFRFLASLNVSNPQGIKKAFLEAIFPHVRNLGPIKAAITKEKLKVEHEFDQDLKTKSRRLGEPLARLPSRGISKDDILSNIKHWTAVEDPMWETGRVSGAVYHGERDHQRFLNQVFGMYSLSNPLHPDIWPSVMKFEAEIIAMTADLVGGGANGPVPSVCGCTSSGGTESIILAIKAHRDYFRVEYGITEPEMIACVSAHAAVDKACEMLRIKLVKVNYDDDGSYRINVNEVKNKINSNTILIYSSAPCYPQGVIDDVKSLGKLAKHFNTGLHVDCCLGGFVLPFAKKLGYAIPDFDFTVAGVTSMSCDTHKYGYALKGTSVLLYRNKEIRSYQYFCYSEWTGGLYTTPTIAGSRSGGLIAQTWASLVSLGEAGYLRHTKDIMECAKKIAAGVSSINGLKVIGATEAMIVCFVGTETINVYGVADRMSKKGWSLNTHQNPASVHICCTVRHVGREDVLLRDLLESVEEVRRDPLKNSSTAAIYGMTSSLPSGPVEDMLRVYNDVVLKL